MDFEPWLEGLVFEALKEPAYFERFFLEYGVDVDEADAFETSVSEATIARVIDGCAQFGMVLAPGDLRSKEGPSS